MSHVNHYQFNGHVKPKLNKTHGVPEDFDWLAYISLNKLDKYSEGKKNKPITSYVDAVKHYLNHGRFQSMKYKHDNILQYAQAVQFHSNKINGVPHDFDWLIYKSSNPELNIVTYNDAIEHYKNHGYRESRKYKSVQETPDPIPAPSENLIIEPLPKEVQIKSESIKIPPDFNWTSYVLLNPDLTSMLSNKQSAIKHYIEHGHRENRQYKSTNVGIEKNPVPISIKLPQKIVIAPKEKLVIKHQPPPSLPISVPHPTPILPKKEPPNPIENILNGFKITKKISVISKPQELKPVIVQNKILIKDMPTTIKIKPKIKIKNIMNGFKSVQDIFKSTPSSIPFSINGMDDGMDDGMKNVPIIYIFGLSENEDERVFSFMKYTAIYSAYKVYNGHPIHLYYYYPSTGYWWDKLISDKIAILHQINYSDDMFRHYSEHIFKSIPNGFKSIHFSERNNIIKMFLLYKHGGFYFDIDTIILRKMPVEMFQYDLVLTKCENSISSAFIYCNGSQNHIIDRWIKNIMNGFKLMAKKHINRNENGNGNGNVYKWDYIYNIIPKMLLKSYSSSQILILSGYTHWEHTHLIFNEIRTKDMLIEIQYGLYLHLWDSVYINQLNSIEHFETEYNTVLNVMCRKFNLIGQIKYIKGTDFHKYGKEILISEKCKQLCCLYCSETSISREINHAEEMLVSEEIAFYIHNDTVTFNKDLLLYDNIYELLDGIYEKWNVCDISERFKTELSKLNKIVHHSIPPK